ncbi:MAG: ankyrin repeat domain-containing protein [Fimbriimonadaceae bacterium]|nr:ankyrin repeat domain-containing protein [Fimbriimonadaceae bacterium]
MRQPDWMRTDAWRIWNGGPGNLVWTVLQTAWDGDLPALQRLLAAHPELLTCQEGYRQPVTLAIQRGHVEMVAWLLEQGLDVTSAGFSLPRTPQRAAYDPRYAAVQELLATYLRERFGVRPAGETIAAAIRERDLAAVTALLAADPSLVTAADANGNSPLHWAALTRNLRLIDLLLQRGAPIDARRPDGARPIEVAFGDYHYRTWYRERGQAMASWHAVVGYLLARGAEYDLVVAAHLGDVEHAEELLRADPSQARALPAYVTYYSGYPLRVAAEAGHRALVELLLAHGADPNRPEPGIAPRGGALNAAAGKGRRAICELLLAHGADPNQDVESSGNVVSMAAHFGHHELVEWLLTQGAQWPEWYLIDRRLAPELAARIAEQPAVGRDVMTFLAAAETGERALWEQFPRCRPDIWQHSEAFWGPTVEATTELLAAGLDPSRAGWLGVTAAHRLAGQGNLPQLTVFLDHGADLTATDDEYASTPLGWAAREGQLAAAELLLARGADPTAAAAAWARPLVWAETNGHAPIATRLRAAGAR